MKKLLSILFATFVFINISSAQPPLPTTKTLKFLIRNDNLDTTQFGTFVKIKPMVAVANPLPAVTTARLIDPPNTQINNVNNFLDIPATAFNKLISVEVPINATTLTIKVKVKDKIDNDTGEKDESNIVRFSVSIQTDVNYIYCLSIELINEGKIKSASESEDPNFFGGKGNTIVIGAGMP